MTPDEIKAASNEPQRVTPEEARKLADLVDRWINCQNEDGFSFDPVRDALRSLADQVERMKEPVCRCGACTELVPRLNKELAEARSDYKALNAERWEVVRQRDEARAEIDQWRELAKMGQLTTKGMIEVKDSYRAERDALQAKMVEQTALYDAAVEVAWELGHDPYLGDEGLTKEDICENIAAKLAERGNL